MSRKWWLWFRLAFQHSKRLSCLNHALNTVLFRHFLSILSCLIGCLELNITLKYDPLLLALDLFLSLRRSNLHLALEDLVFFLALGQLCLHLLKHLLLDHAAERILHGVTGGLEGAQTGVRLGLLFFEFTLDLGVKQDLDEALSGASLLVLLLFIQNFSFNVFFH